MIPLTFDRVSFWYPGCDTPALEQVSFSLKPAEFVLLCGKSGCGKSTLLRQIKPALRPYGHLEGEILFHGRPVTELSERESSARIGFVQQSPDDQIVTDRVWHELAFGLESLGLPTEVIRRRVAEIADFFHMQDWFRAKTAELSGGQKQLLNLASVMVMNPRLIVLDEPTAQLDPVAASDFIAVLKKINQELGVTVLISEHRMEELFPMADRVMLLEQGRLDQFDTPRAVGAYLTRDRESGMFYGLPAVMKVYAQLGGGEACPLTVRESRIWMTGLLGEPEEPPVEEPPAIRKRITSPLRALGEALKGGEKKEPLALSLEDVWFHYEKGGDDLLRGMSLQVRPGECFCMLGGNGAGKSTALKLLCGVEKPQRGQVYAREKTAMVPQDPQALFTEITVGEELEEALCYQELSSGEKERRCREMAEKLSLSSLWEMHPYDLSGGEQQRLAIGKVLLTEPEVLLLDEPTKGLDPFFKRTLGELLRRLLQEGKTVLMVSHDLEFCAEYADRCGMLFDGELIATGSAREFFTGNYFYTTAAHRMAGSWFADAVTWEEVAGRCEEARN